MRASAPRRDVRARLDRAVQHTHPDRTVIPDGAIQHARPNRAVSVTEPQPGRGNPDRVVHRDLRVQNQFK